MSVIIQIQGREAIPVRAIPLLVQLGFGSCAGDAVETTHWADWAETFKLQDAACLIAGVSPAKEMVAWSDKLPPEARYVFERLWKAYMQGAGVYKQPELDSADFQKMLHAIGGNDFEAPIIVPARGIWTVPSSPCYSGGFLTSRSIDNSMAKSIHFSIKSFMRA